MTSFSSSVFTTVDSAGKTATRGYEANYDGKDYKYTGSPDFDTIALERVDKNTTDAMLKKGGRVVQTTTAVVSADGKTRTLTTTGTNAGGQKVNVLVLDRQQRGVRRADDWTLSPQHLDCVAGRNRETSWPRDLI